METTNYATFFFLWFKPQKHLPNQNEIQRNLTNSIRLDNIFVTFFVPCLEIDKVSPLIYLSEDWDVIIVHGEGKPGLGSVR